MKKVQIFESETTTEREARIGVPLLGFGMVVAGSIVAAEPERTASAEWLMGEIDRIRDAGRERGIEIATLALRTEEPR